MTAGLTRMRLFPELPGDAERVNLKFVPPGHLISRLVQLPVMTTAERHRKLVAHLDAQSARLREAQVVRVAGLAPADDAGLRGDKTKMRLVAATLRLGQGEGAFVDLPGLRRDFRCKRGCAFCRLR